MEIRVHLIGDSKEGKQKHEAIAALKEVEIRQVGRSVIWEPSKGVTRARHFINSESERRL